MLLRAAFTLLLFAFLDKGVLGQPCSTPPINLAFYEGTLDKPMICNRPTNVTWEVHTTTDEIYPTPITYSNDTVYPAYTGIYGVNQTCLLIKNATIPGANPIATSGLYRVKTLNNVKLGAKLLVVREGPTCTCNAINSTSLQMNCSVVYADSSYHPINANMTWTSNGNFYAWNTPKRTRIDTVFVSTSTIIVDANVPANYQCTLTFAKPTDIQYAYIATNAPEFTASCHLPFCGGATTTSPRPTTKPPATTWPTTTTKPPATTWPTTTTKPPATTWPTTTTQPPVTTWPLLTTEPPTTTRPFPTSEPPTTAMGSTGCYCPTCPSCQQEQNCTKANDCWSGVANSTDIYDECVVKAELYAKCDRCCQDGLLCGVVVTLRNESRWLIHDPLCDDDTCQVVAVNASCMANDWKLLVEKKITVSGVGDYIEAGNKVNVNAADCSESCKRMMNLP